MAGKYCWVITLQWTNDQGALLARTGVGLIEPGSAATRENMTHDVIANAKKNLGITDREAAVLFLSLEPNEVQKPKKPKKKA